MKNVTHIITGAAIAACGLLILAVSASMSFQGYEREFESLSGAGLIGVGIAGLAFLCAGAVRISLKQDMRDVAIIAAIMAAVCFAGDVYGNNLATGGDVEQEIQQALAGQAAYDTAETALPLVRQRLKTSQSKLDTVSGDDICAAQRLLKAEGLYGGAIDCRNGPVTEAAMLSFGSDLRVKIATLEASEMKHQGVVSVGRPTAPHDLSKLWASIIAFLLTSLSMASSAIGLPLMVGQKREPSVDEAFSEIEDSLDDMEDGLGELFDFVKEVSERRAA